jgi:hypothetical protein
MLASIGFLAVVAAGQGSLDAPPHFTVGGWLAVLVIGVSSGVGYYEVSVVARQAHRANS